MRTQAKVDRFETPRKITYYTGHCFGWLWWLGWVGIPRMCTCLSPRSLLTSIPHRTLAGILTEWGACLYLWKKRFDATVSDLSPSVADGYLALPLVPRAKAWALELATTRSAESPASERTATVLLCCEGFCLSDINTCWMCSGSSAFAIGLVREMLFFYDCSFCLLA